LAEKQERLALSEKERDRLKVLHEVVQGKLTQAQAADQMGITERGFRKLLQRYREKKDEAVVHGLRNRRSNRRLKDETAAQALDAVKRDYRDFGPTLAAEYLSRDLGLEISRETLRQLLIRDGIWKAKPQKISEVHVWRPRRSCRGELVQWDTSTHAWLEDRGAEKMYLIALIDDATSTLFARFVPADSTEHHMRVLWAYLERYGRPQSVYTDKATLFQPALAPGWKGDEPGPKSETQMGRAFRELGIEWIAAHSPQAKGRIERCFGTLQDRLVKGLRLAGAGTLEKANGYLEREFLAEWNVRFGVQAGSGVDAHRPLGETLRLESVLSHAEQRQVRNDYTVAWQGQPWQIPRQEVRSGLRGSRLRIEARLDGTLVARIGSRFVALGLCQQPEKTGAPATARPARRHVPVSGQSRWMDHFSVRKYIPPPTDPDKQWASLAEFIGSGEYGGSSMSRLSTKEIVASANKRGIDPGIYLDGTRAGRNRLELAIQHRTEVLEALAGGGCVPDVAIEAYPDLAPHRPPGTARQATGRQP
jgi:transposase